MSDEEFEFYEPDNDFLTNIPPVSESEEIPQEEIIETEFGDNFKEGLEKEIDLLHLNPREEQDKPFVILSKELDFMGLNKQFIVAFLTKIKDKQETGFKAFPFLNARYLANAYIYLADEKIVDESSMKAYISAKNSWYKGLREGKLDKNIYLDIVDFYRYVLVVQKYL